MLVFYEYESKESEDRTGPSFGSLERENGEVVVAFVLRVCRLERIISFRDVR